GHERQRCQGRARAAAAGGLSFALIHDLFGWRGEPVRGMMTREGSMNPAQVCQSGSAMSVDAKAYTNSLSPEERESLRAIVRKIPLKIIQAQNAFLCDLPELQKDHMGQFVVYHGDQPVFFSKNYHEAASERARQVRSGNEVVLYCIEEGT